MSYESDFDRMLAHYADCMRGYQRSLLFAKECITNARDRRRIYKQRDSYYFSCLSTASSSRHTAKLWLNMAQKARLELQLMFRNSYYDHVYETQHAVA
jgi:hypothetical protein